MENEITEELKVFLERNRIGAELWEKSECDWKGLCEIRADHVAQSQMLSESASLYANLIQKIPGVHSVRWRVKDPDHLLEKIVRKKAAAEEKYAQIAPENYYEIVTDLIGIRALHLFKDDCFDINKNIASIWLPVEKPVAYIRNGDPENLVKKYEEHGLDVRVHPAGYRSVHHVISSQPINRKVYAEVQIRTIFEEGWSEVDHKIRYPNFSNNELVDYFLTIFNRMAGSADEMGSFVTGLAASIQDYQLQIAQTSEKRDESLKSIDELLAQLTELKQQDTDSRETINKLQEEVSKLRGERSVDQILPTRISLSDLNWQNNANVATNALESINKLGDVHRQLKGLSSMSNLAELFQSYDSNKK